MLSCAALCQRHSLLSAVPPYESARLVVRGGRWRVVYLVDNGSNGYLSGGIVSTFCVHCFCFAARLPSCGIVQSCGYVSALAYLFALRSKEFAIALPLRPSDTDRRRDLKALSLRGALVEAARRLWFHFLIFAVFAYTYFSLLRKFVPEQPSASTYHIALGPRNIFDALAYYSALIVWHGEDGWLTVPLFALGIALCYAVARQHVTLLFSIGAYMVTLLPVCLLPNIRAPFYVYCPQIFYALSLCVILSDAIDFFAKSARARRLGVLGVSVLLLSAASASEPASIFRDRVHFYWMVRESCTASVRDARQQLGKAGSGSHIYVSSGQEVPWFFSTTVACDGVKLLRHDQSIDCIARKPAAELLRLYEDDPAEKYFLDYAPGGYLTTRMRGGARTGEAGTLTTGCGLPRNPPTGINPKTAAARHRQQSDARLPETRPAREKCTCPLFARAGPKLRLRQQSDRRDDPDGAGSPQSQTGA